MTIGAIVMTVFLLVSTYVCTHVADIEEKPRDEVRVEIVE